MIVSGISTQGFEREWVTKFKLMALIKNRDSYVYFRIQLFFPYYKLKNTTAELLHALGALSSNSCLPISFEPNEKRQLGYLN